MSKVSSLFALVFALFLLTPGVANAQSFSSSSITIGNGYFGFSMQEYDARSGSGVSISIGNGRFGNHTAIQIHNNRRHFHNDGYRYRQQRRYVQPRVHHPQPIQVIVYESRQVREPIYVYDRWGNLCATGQYRLVWQDVEVYKTAHWDNQYGAYVYYNSHGQLVVYR